MTKDNGKEPDPVSEKDLSGYGAPNYAWSQVRERLEAGITQAPETGGWQPTVRDSALYAEYSAPSAGPPPWHVYEVRPTTVFALGTSEPYGATRWRFQQ